MGTCRFRALIPAPLERVWEFIIDPRNMHRWLPALTEPVAGVDRPLQPGDRVTLWRRDFFRRHSEEHLVEEVVPYRSFRLRAQWPKARRMDVTATVSVEAAHPGATWVEEAISYSLGAGPLAQRLDRWLVNPLFDVLMRRKSGRALRRLGDLLAGEQEGGVSDRGAGARLRRPRIAGEKNSMTFEVQNLCQNKRSCSPPASDNRGKIEFKSAHAREIAGDFTRRAPCNRS